MKQKPGVPTFIFLLLPVLLLAVYSFLQTRHQLIKQVYEERKSLAAVSAKMLHEKLDRLNEIGQSFANWPSFRQGFEDNHWGHAIGMMNTITRDFPYISNVFITDTLGRVMADTTKPGGTIANLRNFSKWYSGIKGNWQPYLSEVYSYPGSPGQITSALAIPLNNTAGKLFGVLVLEVNINKMLEWSNDIDVGKNGFVYIVDQKGNIAINPNYKQPVSVIDYSSVPAVQEALKGKKDVQVLYNPVTKEKSLCAYEQVPVYGWAVIVQEEAGAALSVNQSIRTVLVFYIFFILLAICFIWIILKGLNRQRKTALELKKSDDNIHLLVDNMKDYAIFMLDENGLVNNWNQGAEKINGYSAKEILGRSIELFYTAADIKKGMPAQNLSAAALLGHIESEGWRVRKDGSMFWANTVISAMKDESGALYGYSKITRDITERRKTQEQLELLYRQVNQSNEAIYTVDADRKILSWNKGAEELYGYKKEEVMGKEVMALLNTNVTRAELDGIMQEVSEMNFLRKELHRKTKQGKDVYVLTSSSAIRDEEGKVKGYMIVNVDVTERKKLMEQVKHLANLVEQSSEAIISRGLDRNLISWNRGAELLLGYSKEEALGKSAVGLGFVKFEAGEWAAVQQELENTGSWKSERLFYRKDGSSFFGLVTANMVKNENGEMKAVVFIIKDISLRKQLEESLRTANDELEQKVKERTEQIYRSEKQYRYLFENNPLPMWVLEEVTHRFLDVNEKALQHYGYTREEFLSLTALDIRPVADRSIFLKVNRKAETDIENKHRRIWNHCKKDGSIIQVEIIAHSINFENKTARLILANDVTEKKSTEQKLQLSELRYRSLIENSVEGISLMSKEGDVIYRSPSGEKLLGNGSKKKVIDFAHPDNLEMFRQKFAEALDKPGVPVPYRVQYHHPDGHYFFAEGTFTNLLQVNGVNAVVANYHDVTEKIEAEEKLSASEKRFRALIEKNYDVIIVFDRTMKITYRSPSATLVTGRTDDETMGNAATSNLHPDDLPMLQQQLGLLMQQPGSSADALFRYLRKDGQFVWLEGTASNLLNDENVQGIIFNCRDVSKRKEAEEKLAASEEHFRTLIENSYDVINLVDASLKVIYRSPSAERVTGLTDEDIIGNSIYRSVHPDETEIVTALIKEIFANPGKPIPCKIRSRHKNGHYLWFEGNITNLLHNKNVNAVLVNFRDVTESVLAEEKLASSENRFRALVEKNKDVIMLLDESFKVLYRSPSATTVNGWTDEDAKTIWALQNIHPDDLDEVKQIIKVVMANPGMPYDARFRNRRKDGQYIWLEGVATNLLNDKYVNAIVFNFRDVTERIAAEEKLKEQKAQLQTLGDNLAGVMIYQLIGSEDGSRHFTYVSNGVQRFSGKTPEEVMQDPSILYEMIVEEDRPGFLAAEKETSENLAVFNREVRCRTFQNELRWLKIVSTPRKQPNGQIVWDGFHIDITEQKEAAQKIADSEARFRSLIENNTDAIVLNDAESGILYQSPSVTRILGYEMAERKNKKSLDYVHPENRDDFLQLYEKLKSTPGQPLPFQYRFLHKKGNYVWIEGVVTNLLDDPTVNGYVANYRDITERKEAEENIKQLNEDLEIKIQQRTAQLKKTNEELEAFSYSISHDLRAPLRGIIGFTSILEEEYISHLDDEAKRLTSVIKSNSLKMGDLIDGLLTFSRTGRLDIEKTAINNNAIANDIIAGIDQKSAGTVIEWVLPSLHQSHADPTTIRQVWTNLITNAVKYSSKQAKPRIELGSYTSGNELVFFVKDNGSGFDNKYGNKLFKVFQRLHTNAEFEGNGVGLAIVEKIISKHGGRVWADAEKGVGASFYFSLPVEDTWVGE